VPSATVEAIPDDSSTPVDLSLLAVVGDLPVTLGVSGQLPSREQVIEEIRAVHRATRVWHAREPDQVMKEATAYSSRLAELRLDIRLAGTVDRAYRTLLTPLNDAHEEVYRLARWASRQVAVRGLDQDLIR
jgi:hypothetical protein